MPDSSSSESHPVSVPRRVDSGISLTGNSIDLLILQWYTPAPIDHDSGAWIGAASPEISSKRSVIRALADTLHTRAAPTFVVIPELSLPLALLPDIETLIEEAPKPLVVVAGLEHMSLARYNDLRQSFDAAISPIDPSPARRINAAAIWIATAAGTRRYLQLKRGPADVELSHVMRGAESFLFRSPNQHEGFRLNFAVAICADFTNKDEVLRLRRELGTLEDVTALDLTFVLQMNPNQEAVHFRTSIQAFFDPPVSGAAGEVALIATDKSILVFANQARVGEKEEYGESAIHFRFDPGALRRSDPAPTFSVQSNSGHNHLSAVFREDGPAAYLVEYVPLHRRSPGQPGSTEPPLLRRAVCADLQNAGQQLTFRELAPVTHWLLTSWNRDRKQLAEEAEANFSGIGANKAETIVSWTGAFTESISWWQTRLSDDNLARQHLNTLAGPLDKTDPRIWTLSTTVRLFLRNFVLLRLGTNEEIDLCKTDTGHLTIAATDFAFVSGREQWTWETATSRFYTRRQAALDTTTRPPILILQETLTAVKSGTTYELPMPITEAEKADPDDITAAPRLRHIRVINGDDLYGCLCSATSLEAATSTISARVSEVTG